MMPVLRSNDATFVDLKTISTWLGTKTPPGTVDALVRTRMEDLSPPPSHVAEHSTTDSVAHCQVGRL